MSAAHVHERHELGRHDDEGSHHVVVLVLEDVAVVHVAAAETLEADDDVDDLVRVDADGVLESELIVVEPMRDPVVGRPADAHGRAGAGGCDPAVGLLDGRRVTVEDLERVEVEVDRMSVAGEVDEPPDLGLVQHREEGGGVLEAGRDRAPARDAFLTVRLRFDERE